MNRNGFTLIENLISMMLLTLTMMAGMGFYYNANELTKLVDHKRLATELVNSKVEDLQRLAHSGSSGYAAVVSSGPESITLGGISAQRNVSVTDMSDYKQVQITLNWTEIGKSNSRTISVVTYIAP